jgi:uncharacterized protein (DUF305 family)
MGMLDAEQEKTLYSLEGFTFDTTWLQEMIRHHEGAIAMSRRVLSDGNNPNTRLVALSILQIQIKEVADMQQTLTQLNFSKT